MTADPPARGVQAARPIETHTAHIDTDTLIRALDAAEGMPAAAQLRAHSYQLLRLSPGATVVDVGCGTGLAVAELAEHATHAIGVDLDPAMLTAARSRFPDIDVRAADATDLPLGDGQTHGYRADKLYHILSDPFAALAEARRVGSVVGEELQPVGARRLAGDRTAGQGRPAHTARGDERKTLVSLA